MYRQAGPSRPRRRPDSLWPTGHFEIDHRQERLGPIFHAGATALAHGLIASLTHSYIIIVVYIVIFELCLVACTVSGNRTIIIPS